MKRISSIVTPFIKVLAPTFWFGSLGWMSVLMLLDCLRGGKIPLFFLAAPLLFAGFGYMVMRKTLFDLIDEVYVEGESLLFRQGRKELRVPFRDVKNVSHSVFPNPARTTVSLREPSIFGTELSFTPRMILPFQKDEDINALIDRIDRARG